MTCSWFQWLWTDCVYLHQGEPSAWVKEELPLVILSTWLLDIIFNFYALPPSQLHFQNSMKLARSRWLKLPSQLWTQLFLGHGARWQGGKRECGRADWICLVCRVCTLSELQFTRSRVWDGDFMQVSSGDPPRRRTMWGREQRKQDGRGRGWAKMWFQG